MHKREVDKCALTAVERIIGGGRFEDALVECKSEWPRPDKARQLAAHANSAHGEEILWIIGIDEKTHSLTSPDPVDTASWWSRFSKSFDEVPPGLDDYIVRVGDHQFVTALVFSTDQAPYVIKTGAEESRVDREVPIRSGTRTRSAKRDELLRILRATSTTPEYSLILADLVASRSGKSPNTIILRSHIRIFIDQTTDGRIMLPRHLMSMSIRSTSANSALKRPIRLWVTADEQHHGSGFIKGLGIFNRRDGLVIAGPAVADFSGQGEISAKWEQELANVEIFELETNMNMAGTGRNLHVSQCLHRDARRYWPASLREWRYLKV